MPRPSPFFQFRRSGRTVPQTKQPGTFFFPLGEDYFPYREYRSVFIHVLVDDDLEHGLVADPAFLRLASQFFDDGRIEKNRGRHLPGPGAHDDRGFTPGNVMAQVSGFEFLQLRVFILSTTSHDIAIS